MFLIAETLAEANKTVSIGNLYNKPKHAISNLKDACWVIFLLYVISHILYDHSMNPVKMLIHLEETNIYI